MIGIYKITSPTKRIYIGQSIDIEKRWEMYKRLYCKQQTRLYNSFKKHGVEKHKFEVVCQCSIDELNEMERFYQDAFCVINENGLNCLLTDTKFRRKEYRKRPTIKKIYISKKIIIPKNEKSSKLYSIHSKQYAIEHRVKKYPLYDKTRRKKESIKIVDENTINMRDKIMELIELKKGNIKNDPNKFSITEAFFIIYNFEKNIYNKTIGEDTIRKYCKGLKVRKSIEKRIFKGLGLE